MNVYDSAHALARSLKESDEYHAWEKAKVAAYESDTNKALIEEYKRLQFKLQVSMAGGGSPDEQEMSRLTQIGQLLQYSPECSAFLMSEMRLQRMLADIYQILGQAVGVDLDALRG